MVPGVVLAAGLSSRMGRLKATLAIDPRNETGDTFLTRIIRTFQAAGVEDTVVVVGHEAESVVESVTRRGLSPRFVINGDYQSGQFSSVLAGLRAIDRPGVAGLLMTLVDVPLIAPSTVRGVLARHVACQALIVRPVAHENGVKGARHGHPVLIDRRLFPELYAASPDTGAKPVVRAHISCEGNVEVTDEGAFLDIDTPEDYERFLGPIAGQDESMSIQPEFISADRFRIVGVERYTSNGPQAIQEAWREFGRRAQEARHQRVPEVETPGCRRRDTCWTPPFRPTSSATPSG